MSKFKIGDHVRVTQPTAYWFDQTGVVAETRNEWKYINFMDLDDGGQVAFNDNELILADADPTAELIAANNATFVDAQTRKRAVKDALKAEQPQAPESVEQEPLADWELELLSGRRSVILRTAEKLINGQRAKDYGDACENFQRIADLWAPILRTPVTAEQVALCMAQVKIARLITSPGHEDSWIDIAGYAALGGEIASDGS